MRVVGLPVYPDLVCPTKTEIPSDFIKFRNCSSSFETKMICLPLLEIHPSVAKRPMAYAKLADHLIFTFPLGFIPLFPIFDNYKLIFFLKQVAYTNYFYKKLRFSGVFCVLLFFVFCGCFVFGNQFTFLLFRSGNCPGLSHLAVDFFGGFIANVIKF